MQPMYNIQCYAIAAGSTKYLGLDIVEQILERIGYVVSIVNSGCM